jgi:hypothetical protein
MRKKKAKESTPRAWKVMSRVTDKASGTAGNKLVDASWRAATGKQPPAKPDSPETSLRESIAWTVLSTAGVAVVKSLATRRAAAYFERSTGKLPPALRTPTEPPAQ